MRDDSVLHVVAHCTYSYLAFSLYLKLCMFPGHHFAVICWGWTNARAPMDTRAGTRLLGIGRNRFINTLNQCKENVCLYHPQTNRRTFFRSIPFFPFFLFVVVKRAVGSDTWPSRHVAGPVDFPPWKEQGVCG
jgi:hypothetical protein